MFPSQECDRRPVSCEDGEKLWTLLSLLRKQTSGPFSVDWRTLLSSWIFLHKFHQNLLAGCGLLALWRRGAGVSKELGLLLHQVADDRDLEGSSDPEKVPQPCHFQELPFWEISSVHGQSRRWIVEMDFTRMCWWICFRCTLLYLKSALCQFRDVGLEKLKLKGRYIFICEQSRKMQK